MIAGRGCTIGIPLVQRQGDGMLNLLQMALFEEVGDYRLMQLECVVVVHGGDARWNCTQ